jgi:hypothetical protein
MSDREPLTNCCLRDTARCIVPCAFAWRAAVAMLALLALAWGCAGQDVVAPRGIERVRHVIVIYMENWSFNGPAWISSSPGMTPEGTTAASR